MVLNEENLEDIDPRVGEFDEIDSHYNNRSESIYDPNIKFPDLDLYPTEYEYLELKKKYQSSEWIESNTFENDIYEAKMIGMSFNTDIVIKILNKLTNSYDRCSFLKACVNRNQAKELLYCTSYYDDILSSQDKNFTYDVLCDKELSLKIIDELGLSWFLNRDYNIPLELANSSFVFNYLKDNNIQDFRSKLNKIEILSGSVEIEEKASKYYDSLIDKINDDKNVNDKNMLIEIFYQYLFKDTMYNVLIDINELFRYLEQVNSELLTNEDLLLYKKIVNIDTLSIIEIKTFLNELKDKNVMEKFYDNMRVVKDHSYKEIVKSLYNCDNGHVNEEYSNEFGVNVYELNGEPFKMMIRTTSDVYDATVNPFDCYSLIGDGNVNYYPGEDEKSVVFGFSDIDYRNISNVLEKDSWTCRGRYNSSVNRIMTPDEIVLGGNEYDYSEININNNLRNDEYYQTIRPSFVVAFDSVNEKTLDASRRYNLPIVLIHSDKYDRKKPLENYEIRRYDIEEDIEKMVSDINNRKVGK